MNLHKAQKDTYIEFSTHELTFLGMSGQPYRGTLFIQYISNGEVLDLISIKKYIESLKFEKIVLENISSTIHNKINTALKNDSLCVTCKTTARGGISSTVRYGAKHSDPELKPIVFGN